MDDYARAQLLEMAGVLVKFPYRIHVNVVVLVLAPTHHSIMHQDVWNAKYRKHNDLRRGLRPHDGKRIASCISSDMRNMTVKHQMEGTLVV